MWRGPSQLAGEGEAGPKQPTLASWTIARRAHQDARFQDSALHILIPELGDGAQECAFSPMVLSGTWATLKKFSLNCE